MIKKTTTTRRTPVAKVNQEVEETSVNSELIAEDLPLESDEEKNEILITTLEDQDVITEVLEEKPIQEEPIIKIKKTKSNVKEKSKKKTAKEKEKSKKKAKAKKKKEKAKAKKKKEKAKAKKIANNKLKAKKKKSSKKKK